MRSFSKCYCTPSPDSPPPEKGVMLLLTLRSSLQIYSVVCGYIFASAKQENILKTLPFFLITELN